MTRTERPTALRPSDIVVAIPTLDEGAHIETCVRSLMRGDPALTRVRMVVADGGSRDGTRRIVRRLMETYPELSLVDNPQRIQAAGVNRVARLAARRGARVLVRCDAHAEYPPRFVLRAAEALAARAVQSVVVPLDAAGTGCFQRANAWVVDTPLGSGGAPHRGGRRSGYVDHGHHAAFDLATFLELGGYDETFTHNEDAEYDRRLTAAGGRIWMEASLRVRYRPRADTGSLARQYFRYGAGRARTLAKHGGPWRARQVLPLINLGGLVTCSFAGLFWPAAWMWPAGYGALLAALSAGIAVRRRSLCGLWAGWAAGVMHTAWAAGFAAGWMGRRRMRGRG